MSIRGKLIAMVGAATFLTAVAGAVAERWSVQPSTSEKSEATLEDLGDYGEVPQRYGAGDRWWFLTGDKREIDCLARQGFRLGVTDSNAPEQPGCPQTSWLGPTPAWASHGSGGLIVHSARVVLVDRRGRIRAYHLATEADSLAHPRMNLSALLRVRNGRDDAVR